MATASVFARWASLGPELQSGLRIVARPVLNGGIPAALYCFTWSYLSAAGPGPWSIDERRRRGRVIGRT